MQQSITLWGVFLAGMLSFASPCVLPLVPPYLCYLAGVSFEELAASGHDDMRVSRGRILGAALAFVLGFGTVFVLLGAGASYFGRLIAQNLPYLSIAAGIVIILFGLHFLGAFRIGLFYREARLHIERPTGPFSSYVMGLAFAFGWTPCIGPVLTVVLGLAGREESALQGAGLLALYSAGLGIPFLAAAAFAGLFLRLAGRFRAYIGWVERIMGVLLVLAGLLFLSGQMGSVSYWLLETFPALSRLG